MGDFSDISRDCPYLAQGAVSRRPTNALNVEWLSPSDRCRSADGHKEAAMLRAYNTGVSMREANAVLYLPECTPERCPELKYGAQKGQNDHT